MQTQAGKDSHEGSDGSKDSCGEYLWQIPLEESPPSRDLNFVQSFIYSVGIFPADIFAKETPEPIPC